MHIDFQNNNVLRFSLDYLVISDLSRKKIKIHISNRMWTTETHISYRKDNKEATHKVTSPRHRNTCLPNVFLSTMLTFTLFV